MASSRLLTEEKDDDWIDQRILTFSRLSREEVLVLPEETKKEYFYRLHVKHAKMSTTATDLLTLLSPFSGIDIVALIGATGAGKTTLLTRMIRQIIREQDAAAGHVPYIYINAAANGDRSFSYSVLYRQILAQANEPLIDNKRAVIVRDKVLSVSQERTLAGLRQSVERMLINRAVKILVIDEAVHLLRFGNYSAVMDTLKSLVDSVQAKLVLCGSYNLFDLVTEYGQLARRAEIIHFERYCHDAKGDTREFSRIIEKFEARWPCEEIPDFSSHVDLVMEATLGSVGLFKTVLQQGLGRQLANDGKWDPTFFGKSVKSQKLLNRIRTETLEGERKLFGATYGQSGFIDARSNIGSKRRKE